MKKLGLSKEDSKLKLKLLQSIINEMDEELVTLVDELKTKQAFKEVEWDVLRS